MSQETKRNHMSEGYSLAVRRRRDKSGHQRQPSKRGKLTSYRVQTEGQVRTPKGTERSRGTHFLSSTEGEIS